jgi:hypothetical protein
VVFSGQRILKRAHGDRKRKSGGSAGFAGERESWKTDEHMQIKEGKMIIDGTDPVGREEPGRVPDTSQKDTGGPAIHASPGQEENEELNWARKHIPEEPAPPREPARAPEQPGKPEPEEEPEDPDPPLRVKPGRGKGRPPYRMLKRAIAVAKKRGEVIPVPGGRSDAFDLIICEESRNVFVRFRWSPTLFLSARDIIVRYPRDIGRIVRMPVTCVMAWEFWLFGPGDTWQFFLFTHDGLVEIREDGSIFYRPMLPVPAAESAGSAPGNRVPGKGDEYSPGDDL